MIETKSIRDAMIEYYSGYPKQIQHFIKVEAFASMIAEKEAVDRESAICISILGYIHDIGIKLALKKYNSSNGKYQEELGKEPSYKMVIDKGFSEEMAKRVSYVVAHHHTFSNIDNIEYQILVEADALVNIYEDNIAQEQIQSIKSKVFKTKAGISLLNQIYSL